MRHRLTGNMQFIYTKIELISKSGGNNTHPKLIGIDHLIMKSTFIHVTISNESSSDIVQSSLRKESPKLLVIYFHHKLNSEKWSSP